MNFRHLLGCGTIETPVEMIKHHSNREQTLVMFYNMSQTLHCVKK